MDAGDPPSDESHSDWHPADVSAALKKRGYTLAGISRANGYHPTAAGKALNRSWPALELLIANAIGVAPREIWPSRYGIDLQEQNVAPMKRRGRLVKP